MKKRLALMRGSKPLWQSFAIVFCLFITIGAGMVIVNQINRPGKPDSRAWLELAMSIVRRELRVPPTTAARFYAYTTTVYTETLDVTKDRKQAGAVTSAIIAKMYPAYQSEINAYRNILDTDTVFRTTSQQILDHYTERLSSDGFSLVWDNKSPNIPAKWYRTNYPPLTPMAGRWQYWLVDQTFDVPPPPVIGSDQDKNEIAKVIAATNQRTTRDTDFINYWAGNPGTETPAGIWQNKMYSATGFKLSDKELAKVQADLAQTISDAFIACWRVKFTYWTQRPSMRIEDLETSFHDPPFPGYVSGHSAISKAAAELLSYRLPDQTSEWQQAAQDAKNSRLSAGIHFDIDNQAGEQLGRQVGQAAVAEIQAR